MLNKINIIDKCILRLIANCCISVKYLLPVTDILYKYKHEKIYVYMYKRHLSLINQNTQIGKHDSIFFLLSDTRQ